MNAPELLYVTFRNMVTPYFSSANSILIRLLPNVYLICIVVYCTVLYQITWRRMVG